MSGEVPVDLGLAVVAVLFPSGDLTAHCLQILNASVEALTAQGAQLDFRHVEPTAVLGRVVDLQAFRQVAGFLRGEGLVQRLDSMRVEVVHHQRDPLSLRIARAQHAPDPERPVPACATLASLDMPPTGQGLHLQEDLRDAAAHVLVLPAPGLPGLDRQFLPHFPDQLLVRLVHADHRQPLRIRSRVDLQNVFHAGNERRVCPGRNPPALLHVRLQFVFFNSRWTVIGVYWLLFGYGRSHTNRDAMKHITGGWDIPGIITFLNRIPFTPALNFDNTNTGTTSRPDRISKGIVSNPTIDC